jgi:hypothetical protein
MVFDTESGVDSGGYESARARATGTRNGTGGS